jgi:antirestriction protein
MTSSILDLRDLAKELRELHELIEAEPLVEEAQLALDEDPLDENQRKRLAALEELERDLGGNLHAYAEDEPTAIPEDEFEDYARELAEDIGALPKDAKWPANHIDWNAAAEELRQDYRSVEFDGVTYLVRRY